MLLDRGQLPCGCYADDECSECSPWGPAADEVTARRLHHEREAEVALADKVERERIVYIESKAAR